MQKQQVVLLFLLTVISKLPLHFLQSFSGFIAYFICHINQAQTIKNAQLNLKIALPQLSEDEFQKIHLQATKNEIKSYCEFLSIWGSSPEKNLSRIQNIVGEHHLHQAISDGKGIVLIVPHFGTWEILNTWLSQYTQLTIMYKPAKNSTADAFVKAARSREQAHLVPTNEVGVREIFKALKKGGTTCILPDHSPDQGVDISPWFGIPLYSSQLSAKLIQKTKAAALLIYALRNQTDGFDVTIEPMPQDIYESEQGTLCLHQTLEKLITTYPQHYHWTYKRFQASPATRGLYDKPHKIALDIIHDIRKNA